MPANLGSTESEQNTLVSCLNHVRSAFADDRQAQHSGLGPFTGAQNVLVAGGTFVSFSRIPCKWFSNSFTIG